MKHFFAKQRAALAKKRGRNVTQRELADQLGYTDKAVGMWETEASAPDIARSGDLARVYEVPLAVIHSEIAELAARVQARKSRERAKETAGK
jgi:transcriptional regulator with XRE-family HTH domain